jgi:hypothetical protein
MMVNGGYVVVFGVAKVAKRQRVIEVGVGSRLLRPLSPAIGRCER